eukprot:TRINITY_DN2418_c0_g1_i1.p1 TRINITY_DN2418_c0_g1~~TRINITY_DN2418_c0_g1_i1.p1  ORF type:complete len:244 (+),score=12.36 TRINITY_DN2418_c0_g1_i1:273-1004(+)
MFYSTPTGFENAPVTKFITILLILTSMVSNMFNYHYRMVLTNLALQRGYIWCLITHFFTIDNLGALFFATYLLYSFRFVERQVGSRKYSMFLILNMCVVCAIEVSYLVIQSDMRAKFSGIYGIIFSCLAFYIRYSSISFQTSWKYLNDKSITLLICLELILSGIPWILFPTFGAFLFSYFYKDMGLFKLSIPLLISNFFSSNIIPLLDMQTPNNITDITPVNYIRRTPTPQTQVLTQQTSNPS